MAAIELLVLSGAALPEQPLAPEEGQPYEFRTQDGSLLALSNDPSLTFEPVGIPVRSISLTCANAAAGGTGQIFIRTEGEQYTEARSFVYQTDTQAYTRTIRLPGVQSLAGIRFDLSNIPGDAVTCLPFVLNKASTYRVEPGRVLAYAAVLLCAAALLRRTDRTSLPGATLGSVRDKVVLLGLFSLSLVIGLLYLLAFFPGIVTYDSVEQWAQIATGQFTSWHPAYHTFLMWCMTRLWYSPAVVALFQIIAFALVLAHALDGLGTMFGVPTGILFGLDVLVTISPLNGLLMVTLWKDVLYSIALLLLFRILMGTIHTRGDWLSHPRNWALLGVVAANVALLRFNGAPVAAGTVLLMLLFGPYRKYVVRSLLVATLYVLAVVGPLYTLLRVDMSSRQPAAISLLNPISAHTSAGTPMTDAELAYLDRIRPLGLGWPYNCYDATALYFSGVDFKPLQQDEIQVAWIFARLTARNPSVSLRHFACLSSFVYTPFQPDTAHLETVYLDDASAALSPSWKTFQRLLESASILPRIREFIATGIRTSWLDQTLFLWRPAVYLYAIVLAVLLAAFRSRNRWLLLLLSPLLLQSAVIALTAQLQAVRYQYPVYLISMVYSLPLLYVSVRRPQVLAASPREE